MDQGFKELEKVKSLLSQALGVASHSLQNNRSVSEAKTHIRQAINSVDKAAKSKFRKRDMTQSQFETWWGNIQAGTANAALAPMSPEAHAKSLEQINKMIEVEQDKLKELEDSQNQTPNQLLRD